MDQNAEQKKPGAPGAGAKIAAVAVLVVLIGAVIYAKGARTGSGGPEPQTAQPAAPVQAAAVQTPKPALPKLLELGGKKCIPCKMMAPILDALQAENAGRLEVAFLDVMENPELNLSYNITTIPTQIFYAADGKELFRHTGFYSKDDIRAKWQELGVTLAADAPSTATQAGTRP